MATSVAVYKLAQNKKKSTLISLLKKKRNECQSHYEMEDIHQLIQLNPQRVYFLLLL